jgi:hypothetical protein
MVGVIALSLHVAGTKSMDVIKLNETLFLREKFVNEFYRGSNVGLLARTV